MKPADQKTLSALLRAAEPGARRVVRLLVGHPEDSNDLMQDALMDAFARRDEMPEGVAFDVWVQDLAVQKVMAWRALQRPWRPAAQWLVEDLCESHGLLGEVADVLADPDTELHAGSHVAFCFSAVGRALPFEELLGVVLLDVLGWPLQRAAEVLRMRPDDVTRYAETGRHAIQDLFDRLCGLSNDKAPCDQCRGLWNAGSGRKGPNPDTLGLDVDVAEARLRRRLRVVREAPLDRGPMRKLHDLLYDLMARNETNRETPREEDDTLPETRRHWHGLLEITN